MPGTEGAHAGTRRDAFYTKLPPGNYVFRVTAATPQGGVQIGARISALPSDLPYDQGEIFSMIERARSRSGKVRIHTVSSRIMSTLEDLVLRFDAGERPPCAHEGPVSIP